MPQIAPGFIDVSNRISLGHQTQPEPEQLRKNEPHPVSTLVTISQLLLNLTMDLRLSVHESIQLSVAHNKWPFRFQSLLSRRASKEMWYLRVKHIALQQYRCP